MRRVRSSGTAPELRLQEALRAARLRFQTSVAGLPGKPDMVFRSRKLAVFVDGEFWHGIQWQKRGLNSLAEQFVGNPSREYWIKKILGNQRRDCAATDALLARGWTVLRFWEGDVKRNVQGCVDRIRLALAGVEPGPAAFAPAKTFVAAAPVPADERRGLEALGWRRVESTNCALTFATLPLDLGDVTSPFVVINAAAIEGTRSQGRVLARALHALSRRGYGVDVLIAGARRFFIVGVYGASNREMPEAGRRIRPRFLSGFMARHPRVRWNFRRAPRRDPADWPLVWLAESYLAPAITEIIRTGALSRAGTPPLIH